MLQKKNIILDAALALLLFIIILFMMMLSSCKHEPDILPTSEILNGNGNGTGGIPLQSTCDPDSVYFQTQVLPLLVSNCAKSGCHSLADHKEEIILNNYSNVMLTGDIVPGRARNSDIYKVLIETDPDKRMPPSTPLNRQQIDLVYKWIEQGANNNTCTNSCDTNNVTFSGSIFPIIQGSCLGCHSGTSPGGQILLTDYQQIAIIAQNGKLSESVNHIAGYQPMPKGGNKLPDCQIDQIRIWIENGTLNN